MIKKRILAGLLTIAISFSAISVYASEEKSDFNTDNISTETITSDDIISPNDTNNDTSVSAKEDVSEEKFIGEDVTSEDNESITLIEKKASPDESDNNSVIEEEATFNTQNPTVYTDSVVEINPIYEGILSESDLKRSAQRPVALLNDIPDCYSIEEAGEYLRSKMVDREEEVQICYITSREYNQEMFKEIRDYALQHTGVPNEGDFLRYQYGGYRGRVSYYFSDYYYYTFTYTLTYYTSLEQELILDAYVNGVISSLDLETKNQYQKIEAIYDFICTNTTYDYTNLNDDTYKLKYTAYAALVNKTSVCQGYSVLLYRLMLEAGIDCRVISGYAGGGHAWNIINIGSLYYLADATWDYNYRTNDLPYRYFLCGTSNNFITGEWDYKGHICDDEFNTSLFVSQYPLSENDYVYNEDDFHVHSWNEGEIELAPTTSETGIMKYTCLLCGETYTETIDKLPITEKWIKTTSGKYWYRRADGTYPASKWEKINGKWYHFDASGYMQTGWLKIGSTWYYLGTDGAMRTGWVKVSSTWYYMNSSGAMQTGWIKIGSTWYYLNSSGAMQTGWLKIGSTWYFLKSTGAMATGWLKVNDVWYYFKSSGTMVTGEYTIDGRVSLFASTGKWMGYL